MRRLLCAAFAATALFALPSAASAAAPLVIGIGEQSDGMFSSAPGSSSGARDVRYIVAWDALNSKWQRDETDRYMAAAENAGARVLLGFSHSRSRFKRVRKTLPSPRRFRREFLRFRARYPFIKEYLTWNEANHRGQPTWNRPKLVGRYYDILRNNCRECTIVGPVRARLDQDAAAGSSRSRRPPSTASASGRSTTTSTRIASARAARARCCARRRRRIWFTETGGLVRRDNGSTDRVRRVAAARGEGDEVGAQARPPEPPRPARLLLPLDRARARTPPGTPR